MNINSRSVRKSRQNRENDEIWQITNNVIQDEKALIILSAIEYFGAGPKRISGFLDFIDGIYSEFDDYAKEERLRDKIIEGLNSHKVDISRVYTEIERFDIVGNRLEKKYASEQISVKEAEEIREKLKFMKGLM